MSTRKPKPRADYGIHWKDFIAAWELSASLVEAAKKLGMPKAQCASRAADYRKAGVPLKNMPRPLSKRKLPVREMLKFLEKIRRKSGLGTADPSEQPPPKSKLTDKDKMEIAEGLAKILDEIDRRRR